MFLDTFEKACASIGVSPTRVLINLGIGKSAISNWRNGSIPSNRTRKQIADYFDVTVEEFEQGIYSKKNKLAADESNEREENMKKFINGIKDFTDSELEEVLSYIEFLKAKRK